MDRKRFCKKERHIINIIAIYLVSAILLGIGCGKKNEIIGTWSGQSGCASAQVTFNKDGTGVLESNLVPPMPFKWEIEGDRLKVVFSDGEKINAKFEIKDRTLIVTTEDGTQEFFQKISD